MNKNYQKMASDLAKAGRGGDDQILHVSKSELAGLGSLLPSGKLPINPETGQPEALIFTLPALLISMAIGAGTGAISGGVTAKEKGIPLWEGILTGAGTGAATGMVTAGIGGALAPAGTAVVDAGTKAVAEGTTQALQAGIEQAGSEAVSATIDAGIDASLDTALQETAGGLTKDLIAETGKKSAFDTLAQGAEVLDPVIGEVATGVGEVLPEVAQVAADAGGAVAGTSPSAAPEVIQASGEVLANEAPAAAADVATDVGTEVLVDGAENVAEEGFFEGIKNSALELKEEAIEKLGPNNVEFLDWYTDNPVAMMAPAAITQATQRWELDEDDDDGYYSGPYEKSWETGPGVSWAAKDGGEVRRRKPEPKYDSESLSRIKGLLSMIDRTMNPSIPGKYNPLSDADIQMKLRPSMSGGMHRVGVRLPFRDGGVASSNRFQRGLGSLRRP